MFFYFSLNFKFREILNKERSCEDLLADLPRNARFQFNFWGFFSFFRVFAPARWFSHQHLQKGTLKVNWHIVKYLLHIVYKSILLWAILLHLTLRQSMQFMKVFFFLSMFLFLVPINPVESRPGYRSHVPVIIKSIQAAS